MNFSCISHVYPIITNIGVSYLQHRVVIGSFSCKVTSKYMRPCKSKCNEKWSKNEASNVIYGLICIVYMYVICITMAGAVENTCDVSVKKIHCMFATASHIEYELNNLLGCSVIWLLTLLCKKRTYNYLFRWVHTHGFPFTSSFLNYILSFVCNPRKYSLLHKVYKYTSPKVNCSTMQMLSNFLSIWTTIISLLLIVICNPALVYPGPVLGKGITFMYQNVRGLVPFSGLGENVMPLDTVKLMEIQSKVYNDKPDVVILNETWLSKEHLNQELFPNETYNVYRLDRSKRTHPPDPNKPKRFRVKGGGVLIAIKANIDVEHEKININSKAEILSVSFGDKNAKYCLTTCYRVGTLGEENLNEIDKHLKSIATRKKYKMHIVIGDFNLPSISWSNGYSSIELERRFIDLFNNLGLTQLINQPTHEKGGTLDLLFSNMV